MKPEGMVSAPRHGTDSNPSLIAGGMVWSDTVLLMGHRKSNTFRVDNRMNTGWEKTRGSEDQKSSYCCEKTDNISLYVCIQ